MEEATKDQKESLHLISSSILLSLRYSTKQKVPAKSYLGSISTVLSSPVFISPFVLVWGELHVLIFPNSGWFKSSLSLVESLEYQLFHFFYGNTSWNAHYSAKYQGILFPLTQFGEKFHDITE